MRTVLKFYSLEEQNKAVGLFEYKNDSENHL